VGGGRLDRLGAVGQLRAAQDVAPADDDGQLHAALDDALGDAGDVERLVNVDAALALKAERLAAQLQHDAPVGMPQRVGHRLIHNRAVLIGAS
jgi:hypothetical protein